MVVWAKNPEELPEYGSGDSVDIPINVASYIDLTADKVKFTVIDPDKNVVDTVNVATTVSPYETRAVNFTDTARSKLGIWHLDYSLANDSVGEVQRVRDTQRFAVSKTFTRATRPHAHIWAVRRERFIASARPSKLR